MSERESPEKRTVEHTDELLQKSRRLIDELEFILEKMHEEPRKPKARPANQSEGDAARSD
jgi:hypothetical protein